MALPDLTLELRLPAPTPSRVHGRLPLLPPPSLPQGPSAASHLPPSDPSHTSADPRSNPDHWFHHPPPTRQSFRDALPLMDVVEALTKRKAKAKAKGAQGLGRREHKLLGEWRVGESLGRGTSGHVRLARSTRTGEFAAVKKVKRLPEGDKHAESIYREVSLMKLSAPHPHLVELFDVFETPSHLYLITEFCPDGELFHLVVKRQLTTVEIHRFYSQLVSALTHLSSLSLSHRDVKFENLLLYADPSAPPGQGLMNVKLSDMGMASWQREGEGLKTSCGSPHYAAPEVIRGERYSGSLADVWSAGIVLFTMFARRLPFDDENIPTLMQKIKHDEVDIPECIEGAARDLVRRSLEKAVERRIAIEQINKHPYLRPLPFAPSPLSCEARHPVWLGEEVIVREGELLDEEVLGVLAKVMKLESAAEAGEEVSSGRGRSRLFYSTLLNFRQPRLPPTERDDLSIHLQDDESLHASVQPSMSDLRRSFSAPDLGEFDLPLTLDFTRPRSPRMASPSIQSMQASIVDSGSLLNHDVAVFPPPSLPLPPLPISAPPHIETFVPLVPFPSSPLDLQFFNPTQHTSSGGGRGSRRRAAGVRPNTASTNATQSLPTTPALSGESEFAEQQEQHRQAQPEGGFRRFSTAFSFASTTRTAGSQVPSKKTSMQQRLRNLFQAQGGGGGVGKRPAAAYKPPAELASRPLRHPLPPLPSSAVPSIRARPPSPAPSKASASSRLKRSSAYRSLGRALSGRPPVSPSPMLTEFGELLSLGASASEEARGRHVDTEEGQREGEKGGGKGVARGVRRKLSRHLLVQPKKEKAPKMQVHHDENVNPPSTSSSSMAKRGKRPLPLTINPTNANQLLPPLPITDKPSSSSSTTSSLFSGLGLGRPPRSPFRPSPSPLQTPSLSLSSPFHDNNDDPEDPFALISALRQYPHRTASFGSTRSFPQSSRLDSPAPSNRIPSASEAWEASFRVPSGSTDATSAALSASVRSGSRGREKEARSPRVGDDDDGVVQEDEEGGSFGGSRGRWRSESGRYEEKATSRERELETEVRKLRLENALLEAAVHERDLALTRLQRTERRLTQCLESGEQVVQQLSQEREELEELVRHLDWEKRRSFLDVWVDGGGGAWGGTRGGPRGDREEGGGG